MGGGYIAQLRPASLFTSLVCKHVCTTCLSFSSCDICLYVTVFFGTVCATSFSSRAGEHLVLQYIAWHISLELPDKYLRCEADHVAVPESGQH